MSEEPIQFLGSEKQALNYVNLFVLYDEGGSIVLNCGFFDRLPNVVQELFNDEENTEDISSNQVTSLGRFVMSYSTAQDLLRTLKEILEDDSEGGNNNE